MGLTVTFDRKEKNRPSVTPEDGLDVGAVLRSWPHARAHPTVQPPGTIYQYCVSFMVASIHAST
jgi:hypothetical protein